MTRVDLNADVGEGIGRDDDLLPLLTSANIACGAHAGSPETMRAAVRTALRYGVAIGAHPGFPDRANFGRLPVAMSADDVRRLVRDQVLALGAIALDEGARISHVKPHGALYNMAGTDRELADAIAQAVRDVDVNLILVGQAGSALLHAGSHLGLATAHEAFADRRYRADGSLVPRGRPDALIEDVETAVHQALMLVRDGRVRAVDGQALRIQADTLCLHGDGARPVELASAIRAAFEEAGILVEPLVRPGAVR